ncbi:MAG: 23S rRNA (adenine(2503)-C(2))-methyltransferase RlmN [Leptospiraceae bacterium]|nr:23S rRNA (adenine(2503)-C(2))-methyltransferase RlmN [Leptospiraceae bacterium]MCP5495393.1 23S rRNA (adenine(2503)-C(2))-methyltransferase RlmN [Leptospiraceae bacterium]
MEKIVLKGLTIPKLEDFVLSIGESKYRAKQLYNGLHKQNYYSFNQFTNLPQSLRNKLEEVASIPKIQLVKRLKSVDGTQKMTFDVGNEKLVEAVWIPSNRGERKTICVSSQVGCTLACAFCATGLLNFEGNLKTWQIIDQVIQIEELVGERATNIVFMGMGEPMHNYFSVVSAAHILHDPEAFDLGAKRITISTSGVIPSIERFIKNKEPFNFAISLNHPNPSTRGTIMNIDKKYPLEKLLKTAKEFTQVLKRRITFEYIMIPKVNMGKENATRLIKIAKSMDCKINLIPLNTDFNGWKRPTDEEAQKFMDLLQDANVPVMNRKSPGKDIFGACGMLSLKG